MTLRPLYPMHRISVKRIRRAFGQGEGRSARMPRSRLSVAVLALASLAITPVVRAQEEPLEPPRLPAACQTGYGGTGTVELSWTNAETYDAIELSLDG